MKLISEAIETVEFITEAKEGGGKNFFIEGIFLQGDIKNRNGRMYPISTLEKEVNRYVTEVVKDNRGYGELGHPDGPAINLDRVSHIITELRRDGSNFIGKARLASTPMGDIAKGIMESGGKLGVSSRAMGSLKEDKGMMVVQEDLRISTAADIVADPSAPSAFVKGIMEGVEFIYDASTDSWYQEAIHETKTHLKKMSIREIEEEKMAIFEAFVAQLAVRN